MSGLPEGWELTTLGEVTHQRGEKINPQDQPELPFVGMDDIEGHTGRLLGQQRTGDFKSAVARFEVGDILYGRLRPYLNKVWEAEFEGTASAEFIVMPIAEAIAQAYLQKMLMGPDFIEFTGLVSSGDRPRVSFQSMSGFELTLPPLAEQKRIVAKLDRLSVRSGKAKTHLAQVQTLATRAKQATLSSLIDEQSSSLERIPIERVITALDQGWSPKCKSEPVSSDTSWGVIKTTSIQAFDFLAGANKALPRDLEPRPRLSIKAGDVLITRAGPRVRVGVACYVKQDHANLMICDKVYRLRVAPKNTNPKYLTAVLNSPASLVQLESLKTGGNDSGLNLTQKRFRNLTAPFPGIDKQTEIVRRIETAFAKIDRMVEDASRAAELLDRLDQQLLAKAFRGELVPQDPNDEPASALLARIREARAAAPKPKRRRKAAS